MIPEREPDFSVESYCQPGQLHYFWVKERIDMFMDKIQYFIIKNNRLESNDGAMYFPEFEDRFFKVYKNWEFNKEIKRVLEEK